MNEDARRLRQRARDLAARLSSPAEPGPAGDAGSEAAGINPAPGRPLPSVGRLGLVLAGGGARGAYQAGVAEVVAGLGIPVVAIGGASIGALNGAVLACAQSFREGASALAGMWREVAAAVAAAGPVVPPPGWRDSQPLARQLELLIQHAASPVLKPDFIAAMTSRYVDQARLAAGPRLWVTATAATDLDQYLRPVGWLFDLGRAVLDRQAEWICVNEQPEADMVPALLASAALPLVFSPRKVGTQRYRDGGLTDNVPVRPLVENCQCDLIVVVHLNPSDQVDSDRLPGTQILEVRPRRSLNHPGALGGAIGLLDFSPARVEDLISEGRRDAEQTIGLLAAGVDSLARFRHSAQRLLDTLPEAD
jgi:NTE family protein